MKNAYQQQHEAELTKILTAKPKDAAPDFAEFLRQFYAKMPVC
jgi:hypothetical protein